MSEAITQPAPKRADRKRAEAFTSADLARIGSFPLWTRAMFIVGGLLFVGAVLSLWATPLIGNQISVMVSFGVLAGGSGLIATALRRAAGLLAQR